MRSENRKISILFGWSMCQILAWSQLLSWRLNKFKKVNHKKTIAHNIAIKKEDLVSCNYQMIPESSDLSHTAAKERSQKQRRTAHRRSSSRYSRISLATQPSALISDLVEWSTNRSVAFNRGNRVNCEMLVLERLRGSFKLYLFSSCSYTFSSFWRETSDLKFQDW